MCPVQTVTYVSGRSIKDLANLSRAAPQSEAPQSHHEDPENDAQFRNHRGGDC